MTPKRSPKIFIAGHQGMVGSAIVRALKGGGFENLLLVPRRELDLTCQADVERFFRQSKPDVVIFAAARVGGIQANALHPAEFLSENLLMAAHAVTSAWRAGVQRFVYLGSTCAYPAQAPQPAPESSLLTGVPETTNESYAVAKIAGVKLCQAFRRQYGVTYHSIMPTNLYGPGDRYDSVGSHVIPALIHRFHQAKLGLQSEAPIWGSGTALRDFLYVDDLARAVLCVLAVPDPPDVVNAGSGQEISILDLAAIIADVVGFTGEISRDSAMPEGVSRKLADIRLIQSLGWNPQVSLRDGLHLTYTDYCSRLAGRTHHGALPRLGE